MGKDQTKYFQDRVIKVDRGGPESRIGMLMDESEDYLCLLTEDDGLVYHNTKHIKSFTDNLKEQFKFDVDVPKDFAFKKAKNFKDLLKSLEYRWVNINRGGTETVEGVLCEVKNDLVLLVNNGEIVRIAMSHIKNVSYEVKIEKAKSEKHESRQKSNDKSENNNNNTYCSPQVTSQKLRQESIDTSENNYHNTNNSPQGNSQKLRQESIDTSENNNHNTNNSPQGNSQKLHQESIDTSENNNHNTNSSPQETSQILRQESNDASENNNHNTNSSPQGTLQKTSIENELDLSVLLSSLFSLEKILRRLNF
ncbi:hypothetical protein J7E63_05625 [Bacillus sp. ISL-75]|uniref:hypothetical protein n=1 Tax=Bacillus sp. ISL-75 TaxID=2819137 RepID=UPI001BE71304|nr:hypothetical protein [Bacillus sp. ISL-75]MBT2726419.1 hypothetical protein [Bacillus sp. ISL-75]